MRYRWPSRYACGKSHLNLRCHLISPYSFNTLHKYKVKHWLFISMLAMNCTAVAQTIPQWFAVQENTPKGSTVRSFHCEQDKSHATCKETEVSVGYYDWSTTPKDKELKRCAVNTGTVEGQTYNFTFPNRWQHIEQGGICRATIAINLIVDAKSVNMEQITLDNPGMDIGEGQFVAIHGVHQELSDCTSRFSLWVWATGLKCLAHP